MKTSETYTIKENKTPRIYTKLKFKQSTKTGIMVALVSQNTKTGFVRGVRKLSRYPKKICIPDVAIADQIMPNTLYDCTLIPMKDKDGYIVIAVSPTLFKARIEVDYLKRSTYVVSVKFGNKILRFDPLKGKKSSVYDLKEFLTILKQRKDIKDLDMVIKDFKESADNMVRILNHDLYSRHRIF